MARTADGEVIYTGYVAAPYGTLAEPMAVPGGMRLPLPAGADPVAVAGGLNPGLSSWMPLLARKDEVGELGPVAVLGVTGMAGLLAVQNARILGAVTVPTRAYPLSRVGEAWTAAAGGSGPRPVVVPD